jgi:hypothetical protein
LKNAHLLRCAHHSSLRRTEKYASFLMILRALHPGIFEQPAKKILTTIFAGFCEKSVLVDMRKYY